VLYLGKKLNLELAKRLNTKLVYPLKLTANPEGWRIFMLRKKDPAFDYFRQTVLARDQFTCQYCGFRASIDQEVINLNHNYKQNSLVNLVTACMFCAQCNFLESLGPDSYGGGTLIYLPECTQIQLNGFCHVLFARILSETTQAELAQQYYRSLKLRAQVVEEQLGDGMSEPAVFGRLLAESGAQIMENTFMAHLCLLPGQALFKSHVTRWLADQAAPLSALHARDLLQNSVLDSNSSLDQSL
jgi:intracellular multiplication protein IcmJ